MKYGVKTKIPATVGMMSLIGVRGEFPVSWGNYFWFGNNGPRCVNMWSENLDEARVRFLTDGAIEGYLFDDKYFVVADDRIPVEWLYNKFCFTGGYSPKDPEIIGEMYSIHGDPTNAAEEYLDPATYHKKRGGEYIVSKDGFAIIKYNMDNSVKNTTDDCTIGGSVVKGTSTTDVGMFYAPYIPNFK
jgi:hypothetical protein